MLWDCVEPQCQSLVRWGWAFCRWIFANELTLLSRVSEIQDLSELQTLVAECQIKFPTAPKSAHSWSLRLSPPRLIQLGRELFYKEEIYQVWRAQHLKGCREEKPVQLG
jgi:hypothetical protein